MATQWIPIDIKKSPGEINIWKMLKMKIFQVEGDQKGLIDPKTTSSTRNKPLLRPNSKQ